MRQSVKGLWSLKTFVGVKGELQCQLLQHIACDRQALPQVHIILLNDEIKKLAYYLRAD